MAWERRMQWKEGALRFEGPNREGGMQRLQWWPVVGMNDTMTYEREDVVKVEYTMRQTTVVVRKQR